MMLRLLQAVPNALGLSEVLAGLGVRSHGFRPCGAWALVLLRVLRRGLGLLLQRLRRLLLGLRNDNRFRSCCILPGPALTARSNVDEGFTLAVVGSWRRRSRDQAVENVVEVVGQFVTAWVYVDGRDEGLDEDGLFYSPFNPVMFGGKDGDVLLPEMVIVFPGMLQHGRFIFTESIGGSGSMLLKSSCGGPLCFANIAAWAGCGICSCTWNMVNVAVGFFFVQLVFGMD